ENKEDFIDVLPLIGILLDCDEIELKSTSYNSLYQFYFECSNRNAKDYIFSMKNKIIEAMMLMPDYKKGKGLGYENIIKKINKVKSWKPDDPLSEPNNTTSDTQPTIIDLEGIKEDTLYEDFQ
ncbi:MAG: hypothetical protein ABIH86_00855, partial [Planctomycetota bacterium]